MQKLGADPILIGVQIINFGLLLFLLKKIIYKPILKKIKDHLKKLKTIEKEKAILDEEKLKAEEKRTALLKTAQKEREQILEEARNQAEAEGRKITEKANKTARDFLKKASLQTEREKERAGREMEAKVIKLSLAIARKITKKLMIGKIRQRSVGFAIKELRKIKSLNEI